MVIAAIIATIGLVLALALYLAARHAAASARHIELAAANALATAIAASRAAEAARALAWERKAALEVAEWMVENYPIRVLAEEPQAAQSTQEALRRARDLGAEVDSLEVRWEWIKFHYPSI